MTTRIQGMEQMRAFLEGTGEVEFAIPARLERHAWIAQTLEQVGYRRLKRKERGVAIRYLCRVTGNSRQRMTRLIGQGRVHGVVEDGRKGPAQPFATRYTAQDVALLAEGLAGTARCPGRPPGSCASGRWSAFGTSASRSSARTLK